MRGVNHAHTWFTNQTSSFANIKALGANTVRVVLQRRPVDRQQSSRRRQRDLAVQAEQADLRPGGPRHHRVRRGRRGAYTLDQAVNYWISLKSALVGQENYVVINIGNEPIGNTNPAQWTGATTAAIQKMRSNGFQHLLMVDAPNWGQDWQYVMRDNAQTVLDADTQHNTVLSIHMYGVFNTAAAITDYLERVPDATGWPLVIGEFGWQFARRRGRRRDDPGRGGRPAASATSAGRGPATATRSWT